jgi:predicted nucleotidyltransferase
METKHKESGDSVENNLASDYVPKAKLGNLPNMNPIDEEIKKKMDKTKKEIDKFSDEIKKKFKYIEAIGILPAQAAKKIEEEFEVPEEECKKGLIHVVTFIPEDHFKELGKVRLEAINLSRSINDKLWVHVLTPVDFWNLGLDSKFEVMEAVAMSMPIFDKGFLSGIRVSQIHKTLVLRKFEKYVTSYVIGGSLVTGTATKDSDVDVFVVIDDTDVKRMPRLELKEKLRGIIYSYIPEAEAIAGVKGKLNVQIYLLTDFWESVKDAHPVMFTFIRDGVPMYDRGTFLPWKSLLRMGKIKPSSEAIDMFMSSGDKLETSVNRRLLDIAVLDIYWGILTPTQGLLMLYGMAPPTPKEIMKTVEDVFYKKEKMLEKKYIDIFNSIIKYYKDYEHGLHKTISGTDLDKMIKDSLDYIKRLGELRSQIEKRVQEKSIEDVYKDIFGMLEVILKKKSEAAILKAFDEQLVKEGRLPAKLLDRLKFIAKIKKDVLGKSDTKKPDKTAETKQRGEVDMARKYATEISSTLVEYTQRCDFMSMDRTRFVLKGREMNAEVFFLNNLFVIQGAKIEKLVGNKLVEANTEELKDQLLAHKNKETKIDFKALEGLKKAFGEFELVY